MKEFETIIGLEVHLELSTKSKLFCGCSTEFGKAPNTQTCPVCLGFPGVLPVLNEEALNYAVKVALALNCQIADTMKFDRKNYFYPDLPKNFQISQYDQPLARNGFLEIEKDEGLNKKKIRRVHLEEDAGKLVHKERESLVDFNRSGIPLLEIVSEPDIFSPEEAYNYLVYLKATLEYLDVSDCNMEEGSLRCDANISIRPKGAKELGTKREVKNMNSFKAVRAALVYEAQRQMEVIESGEKIEQETRLWDPDKKITISMRSKEEAHDYRYFPEPDLVPFVIDRPAVDLIKTSLPELPRQKKARFIKAYGLGEYDAGVLVQEKALAGYFEECAKSYKNPKIVANWLTGDILGELNARNMTPNQLKLKPAGLVEMLKMIDAGTISGKIAKGLIPEIVESGRSPAEIVKAKGIVQIADMEELQKIARQILAENQKVAEDYKNGKKQALVFLVGQLMKATKGRANPKLANEILEKELQL